MSIHYNNSSDQLCQEHMHETFEDYMIRAILKYGDMFFNLAFERKLFEAYKLKPTKGSQLPDHTLYLWCNAPSVVIGRYQNVHKECRLNAIEHDNVNFIRRKSGGGAVYQDLGNSLYTM